MQLKVTSGQRGLLLESPEELRGWGLRFEADPALSLLAAVTRAKQAAITLGVPIRIDYHGVLFTVQTNSDVAELVANVSELKGQGP